MLQPPEPKPERYVVYWYDWPKGRRLAKERGVSEEDIDPTNIEEMADFDKLEDARAFCKKKERTGAYIEERVGIEVKMRDGYAYWDWEQERLD